MAGGLVQIAVYGAQDIFLTGTPQITFFRVVYRRHTNFAIESIAQQFIGITNFGSEATCIYEKIGDLISDTYLEIELPRINLVKNPTYWAVTEQMARNNYEAIRDYYQLVYSYIAINSDVARKLLFLCKTQNVSMESITKTMLDPNFIGELIQKRNELKLYISTSRIFDTITEFRGRKLDILQQISRVDVQIRFLSLILTLDRGCDALVISLKPNCFQEATSYQSAVANIVCQSPCVIVNENTPCDTLDIIKRHSTVKLIKEQLYPSQKIFYLEAYDIYVRKQRVLNEFQLGTYVERYNFAWVEEIGHAIIDTLEVKIGNQRIEIQTGDWYIVRDKLFRRAYQDRNYRKMIGDVPELTNFDDKIKEAYILRIPLHLFYTQTKGLSFPMISLAHQDFMLTVRFKNLTQVCYVSANPELIDIPNVQSVYNINLNAVSLYIDYIFLDSEERRRFAQSMHEYLIEIVQYDEFEQLTDSLIPTTDINGVTTLALPEWLNLHLTFAHPTKYVIWFAQPTQYRANPSGTNRCQWNNFGTNPDKTGFTMSNTFIRLNQYPRTSDTHDIKYFNYVQPWTYFQHSPTDGLNVYSFGIHPMDHQPSGTCNLSRIDDFGLNLTFTPEFLNLISTTDVDGVVPGIYIGVYTKSYNILRIVSGMAGLAFQTST